MVDSTTPAHLRNNEHPIVIGFHQAFASHTGGIVGLHVFHDGSLALVYFYADGVNVSIPLTTPDIPKLTAMLHDCLHDRDCEVS